MADVYADIYLAVIIIPLYIIVTALQMVLYLVTLTLTQRRIKVMQQLCGGGRRGSSFIGSGGGGGNNATGSSSLHPEWRRSTSYRGSMNLTKTGALVLLSFVICWLPFFITLSLQVHHFNIHV